MNKTYKLTDLLCEIELGNIKERTKIEMINKEDTWKEELIYLNGDLITECGDDLFETYTLLTILHSEFTLIEEEPEEIDIQKSQEINWEEIGEKLAGIYLEVWKGVEKALKEGINENRNKI